MLMNMGQAFRRVFAMGALLALAGCFPYAKTYVYIDAPGTQLRELCRDYGPPIALAYDVEGVRTEISLEPGNSTRSGPYVKLLAADNVAITMSDLTARIEQAGAQPVAVSLRPVDTMREPSGRLASTKKRGSATLYQLEFLGLPPLNSAGTALLPAMVINGVAVPGKSIRFERRPFAGMVPLNC